MIIYSNNPAHAGNYTINLCIELDNIYNWGNLGETFRSTDRKYSPDNPPANLIYKECVEVTVTMENKWMNQPTKNVTYEKLNIARLNTPPRLPI